MTDIPDGNGEDIPEDILPDIEDDERYEEISYFVGECTCDHEMEDHGWGHCGYNDCECEAGWEE